MKGMYICNIYNRRLGGFGEKKNPLANILGWKPQFQKKKISKMSLMLTEWQKVSLWKCTLATFLKNHSFGFNMPPDLYVNISLWH